MKMFASPAREERSLARHRDECLGYLGIILRVDPGGSSSQTWWLMVVATHVHLEYVLISQYLPFPTVIFQPALVLPPNPLRIPPPPVIRKKDGMRACTPCPLGECPGSIHQASQSWLIDFQDSFIICLIIDCSFLCLIPKLHSGNLI